VIGAECEDGQCIDRICNAAGPGPEGAACESDAQCAAGLRCSIVGLGLVCAPEGSGDFGAECATSSDCFGGLVCLGGACASAPGGGGPVFGEAWSGVECEEPVETGVKAYFEVPGAAGADEGDFFRLPFPTDVRRSGNKLDLSGFPTPGDKLLGVDPVQLYVDAISDNDSGWGTYPTVIFRFSGPFLFGTFARDAVQFIDVTEPAEGRNVGWQRFYTDGRSNYVCDNFVAVQPPTGSPLEPGHTYAVYIVGEAGGVTLLERGEQHDDPADDCTIDGAEGTAVCDVPVGRSENMAAVLADAAPTDPALKAAHGAFAPLRAYLAAKNLPSDNVLTASVFTVGDVRAPMTDLAEAVAAGDVPVASDWIKCGGAAVSPCVQAEGDRACADDVAGYDEYHALLALPVYQQGTAPYLTPEDGGGIDTNKPHTEEICMSITVPEGTPPAAGWPTVVFAHGTGGSFRSHVRPEVAGVLAEATPKFAVIGIDQVEHGPRRGDSTQSPNNLFFNFLNPAATRGNPLQGAADQLSVARFAKALNVDGATTGGSAIKVDPTKLYFFGHSQGATEGSVMLPFGDDYQAAVLSGNGASLRDALRTKTKPENVAAALPIVLQDPTMLDPGLGAGVTANHPVLSLLQQWIDPADPLNFAGVIGAPLQGHTGKHVFQTFGVDDSYSPPLTMATFALAAGLKQVEAHESAEPLFDTFDDQLVPAPVGYRAPGSGMTLGMRQYGAPQGSDGHFVVFDTQAANDDMVLFLTGATGVTPPVIGQ
jgi:predicted esterase